MVLENGSITETSAQYCQGACLIAEEDQQDSTVRQVPVRVETAAGEERVQMRAVKTVQAAMDAQWVS